MTRAHNFAAGPAALPEAVLRQAQEELLDCGQGMSVMEMSHRSAQFRAIAEQAEADLRTLMRISDEYAVLFLQGGATQQFAMVPLNLAGPDASVDYIRTGSWSKKATAEAQRFCRVNVVADGAEAGYTAIPPLSSWQLDPDAAYVHYTPNETIGGVEFHSVPEVGSVALVGDMSSTILSRPIEVSRFGLIYAGAQKNIGPAGLTVVIVRRDLLGMARSGTPTMLDYQSLAEAGSMLNTPPTFAWYLAGLVFRWLLDQGGLDEMGARNERKARKLYAAIDESDFYSNPVARACRSWMNVPFTLADAARDGGFLAEAATAGLVNLKGHRSVGGIRASLYNATAEEAVDALVEFMRDFEQRRA